jgi:rod shape-determining protein MreD
MDAAVRVTPARVALVAVGLVVAVLLQGTLLARLPLPGGTPNLVIVVVLAVGLAAGGSAGMSTGFAAGLLTDLLSDHPVGLLALCFALAGFVAGLLETDAERSVLWPLLIVGVGAAGTFLLYLGLLAVLGRPSAGGLGDLPSTVLYDVMLTPFVVPVVAAVTRRLDAETRS